MKMIPGKWYYVSDSGEKQAAKHKLKYLFLRYNMDGDMLFEHPEVISLLIPWKYAVPVEEDEEMDEIKDGDEVYVSDVSIAEIKEGDEVYVSDVSIADALENKEKRIYLMPLKNGRHLCVVHGGDEHERYKNNSGFDVMQWKYVVPVPKQTELTMAQIAEKFGVPVEQLRIKE